MRKIKNVHLHENPERYQCFGCSPHNKLGLHLEFWEDGDYVVSFWDPHRELMGWENILHGGIQATLMDEVSGWLVYVKCGTAGVTAELNAKYRKPLVMGKGPVTIKSRLKEKNHRFAIIESSIINDGELCSEAELKFFLYPESIAKAKFHYPGVEAFFDQE